jgi:anti-sigma-K factor RskA
VNLHDAEDREIAAAEYVLGTLSADELASFLIALDADPELQRQVYAWQDRLLDLARRTSPEMPTADLWSRIEAKLPGAVESVGARPRTAANESFWDRAATWRWASGLAMAASVVLAVALATRGPAPETHTRYVALLQSPDATHATGWIVEAVEGEGVRLVPAGAGAGDAAPSGKALQFWTKPQGAKGPTSLGLVRAGSVNQVSIDKLPALGSSQLFEVTLEPEGGSTIGKPTGTVLYVGSTVRL